MSRLETMARFAEPDDREPEIYSNCWHCGDDLVEGQKIVKIEQYFFCDSECLLDSSKYTRLGVK
ncbi:hypothetical protein [Halobacillus karajensis]|uniref:hypothetical protein n=1 Tax=Halobacillus karajensis TaxID=195088 RepID=UPI00045D08EF|nr:hypothetical protein [Halobacillus karajensis]CDQ21745.1 hypothetical protein BN982_04154 [Halobacillus karajensis]